MISTERDRPSDNAVTGRARSDPMTLFSGRAGIRLIDHMYARIYVATSGGSVAEWLACWTHAHKGPGPNRSRDAVGQQS